MIADPTAPSKLMPASYEIVTRPAANRHGWCTRLIYHYHAGTLSARTGCNPYASVPTPHSPLFNLFDAPRGPGQSISFVLTGPNVRFVRIGHRYYRPIPYPDLPRGWGIVVVARQVGEPALRVTGEPPATPSGAYAYVTEPRPPKAIGAPTPTQLEEDRAANLAGTTAAEEIVAVSTPRNR